MTTTNLSELGRESRNRCDFGYIWEACDSPVFLVLDEEGNNVANGQVRHLLGDSYLYVDDTDGYQIISVKNYGYLILSPKS
jgi:hypothetical protein